MNLKETKYYLICRKKAEPRLISVSYCVKYSKSDLDAFIAQNTTGEAA